MILVFHIDEALNIYSFGSLEFKLMKGEYLVALNRFKVKFLNNILRLCFNLKQTAYMFFNRKLM